MKGSAAGAANARTIVGYGFRRAQEEYGSVAASKTELAGRMADLILDDLRKHDPEVVSARRPIASMLISVFRAT